MAVNRKRDLNLTAWEKTEIILKGEKNKRESLPGAILGRVVLGAQRHRPFRDIRCIPREVSAAKLQSSRRPRGTSAQRGHAANRWARLRRRD
jgi:hypothetical protein